jgi:hypothetical protein
VRVLLDWARTGVSIPGFEKIETRFRKTTTMQWDANLQWERTWGRGRRVFVDEQNDTILWVFFIFNF